MNTVPNLKERLAAMNDAWQTADDGSQLPDGTYQALVQAFDPIEGGGRAFLKTVFVIQHHETYSGREVEVIHSLEDPDRIHYLRKHLRILGIELDDLGDLETVLHTALDVPVEIAVKASDRINDFTGLPYLNVYVNERLGDPLQRTDVPIDVESAHDQLDVDGGQRQRTNAINDSEIPF